MNTPDPLSIEDETVETVKSDGITIHHIVIEEVSVGHSVTCFDPDV